VPVKFDHDAPPPERIEELTWPMLFQNGPTERLSIGVEYVECDNDGHKIIPQKLVTFVMGHMGSDEHEHVMRLSPHMLLEMLPRMREMALYALHYNAASFPGAKVVKLKRD
jgi:hypothetical protein